MYQRVPHGFIGKSVRAPQHRKSCEVLFLSEQVGIILATTHEFTILGLTGLQTANAGEDSLLIDFFLEKILKSRRARHYVQ